MSEFVEREGIEIFADLPSKVAGLARYGDMVLAACEDGSCWVIDEDGTVSELVV